jgi:hypothetical protein
MFATGSLANLALRLSDIRLGSKPVVMAFRRDVRFAPYQQTSSGCLGRSEKCQEATLRTFQRRLKYHLTLPSHFNIS